MRGYFRDASADLTKHEQRILKLYARFLDVYKIACKVRRNVPAVYKTLQAIRKKFHADTNGQALQCAVERGIVPCNLRVRNPLSARERQILKGVLLGGSAAIIAGELGISRSAVKNFYAIAKAKMRVKSVLDAALRAESMGLLDSKLVTLKAANALSRNRPTIVLTPREEEVLALIDRGVHEIIQIAKMLGLQRSTVVGHLRRLEKKLNARAIREIPKIARQMGVITRRRAARGHERHSLTREQMAVLRTLQLGLNQVQIAGTLGLQRRSVVAHIASLRRYFGVYRTSDICPAARRKGI